MLCGNVDFSGFHKKKEDGQEGLPKLYLYFEEKIKQAAKGMM